MVVERRFTAVHARTLLAFPAKNVIHSPKVASPFWRVSEFGITTGTLASPSLLFLKCLHRRSDSADAAGAGLNRAQSQVMVNLRRVQASEIHHMNQESPFSVLNFVRRLVVPPGGYTHRCPAWVGISPQLGKRPTLLGFRCGNRSENSLFMLAGA